jgi:mannonate dehydratase
LSPTEDLLVRITDARVIVCRPGRNFVTVRIECEDGTHGVGDATLNGREMAVAAYLEEHLLPALIGRDARDIEDIWQYAYRGAYWRRGPVTMTAIAGIDTALWDILGKRLGVPCHELLGGRSRREVLVYGHASGETIDDAVEAVAHYRDLGYRAIRAQCGIPGLPGAYGVGRGKMQYEPAEAGLAPEQEWSTERYLDVAPELFRRLREQFGHEVHLLHDAHHRLTPTQAGWLGKQLEPYRLFWLEDAVPAENQQLFRQLRAHTTIPLAVGEIFNSVYDLHLLVTERLVDYIRTSVVHAGGITGIRKITSLMEPYQVRLGSHGATDLSPICMAAALQVDVSINNFGIQEYMRHAEETEQVFPHTWWFADGALHPGDAPGLGVDIDEELAAQYPYEPAALPVNRLSDGTLTDW